jgi:tetratricopeptide (TPR) repeat protein
MALGDTYLSLNDPGRAAVIYQEATSIDPSAANAWFGLGVSALASMESSGRVLAEQHATSAWARALFADALFAQKRNSESMDIYKEITAKATPDELLVFAATMNAMVRNPELFGVPENAVSKFHEILPQLSDLPGPTACVLASKSYVASNYAGKERKQAACSFWQGNFDGAADFARRALRAQPDEPESLYWSVKANEHRAVAAFSRFEALAPRSAATHDMLGDLYRRQFQTDKALREYEKALAINPGDPAALLGKAAGFFYDLNLAETIATAKLGLMDRPDDPQLNLLVAEALVREANYQEAKPYLQKSFSAPPELLARVHALQSKIYASEGNTARAIEELKMALPADEDGNIYYQLARLYRTEGRTEEAKKAEAECKILVKRRLERAEVAIRSSDRN